MRFETYPKSFYFKQIDRKKAFFWGVCTIKYFFNFGDPNFSPFCNEIPLLNGTDLTQILWDPSWKKKGGSHKYIRKSEHMLYFRWKKKWTTIFLFLANFVHFGGNESNFEEFSEFQLFLIKFTLLLQNFFSKFPKKSSLLPKMAKINKKSLVNPMIFKFLSLEISILGQKAFKTTLHKKYSI